MCNSLNKEREPSIGTTTRMKNKNTYNIRDQKKKQETKKKLATSNVKVPMNSHIAMQNKRNKYQNKSLI